MRGALRAGAVVLRDAARQNINRVSGELAKSLTVSSRARAGEVTAKVYTRVFYARFVEFGTRPHRIEPKNRKALALANGVLVEGVDHPGARPHPFLRPALDTRAREAVVAVGERIKARLTKAGIETPDVEIS